MCNIGNFLQPLAIPEALTERSLTTRSEKLIKIDAKVVLYCRNLAFLVAEAAIPRRLFAAIVVIIAALGDDTSARPASIRGNTTENLRLFCAERGLSGLREPHDVKRRWISLSSVRKLAGIIRPALEKDGHMGNAGSVLWGRNIFFVLFTTLICTTSCGGASQEKQPTQRSVRENRITPNGVRCTTYLNVNPGFSCYERDPGWPGVRCSGYFAPNAGERRRGLLGNYALPPKNYSVRSIGKPNVPILSPAQESIVNVLLKKTRSKALRFVFLTLNNSRTKRFVVFNALYGPCTDSVGLYGVLNIASNSSYAYYENGEDPYELYYASKKMP